MATPRRAPARPGGGARGPLNPSQNGDSAGGRRPRGSAKDRALGLLAVRWRSRAELERRLTAAGFGATEIASALDDLERVDLIDDERFAAALVRDRGGRACQGDRAIRSALRSAGVGAEVAEAAMAAAGDEAERARRLAEGRAGRLKGAEPAVAYRRLLSLLLRKGYGPDVAREACRGAVSDRLEG